MRNHIIRTIGIIGVVSVSMAGGAKVTNAQYHEAEKAAHTPAALRYSPKFEVTWHTADAGIFVYRPPGGSDITNHFECVPAAPQNQTVPSTTTTKPTPPPVTVVIRQHNVFSKITTRTCAKSPLTAMPTIGIPSMCSGHRMLSTS